MKPKETLIEEAVRSSKMPRARRLIIALALIALALALVALYFFWVSYSGQKSQADAGTNLAEQVRAACLDPTRVTDELEDLCDDAEEVVKSAPAPAGPQGEVGPPGPPPSDSQVASAVALYCEGGRCDGRSVTPSQVAEAVAAYCNARGECRGPGGEDGSDGQDGATGDRGEPGPPPTAEQISSAVSTYCSAQPGGSCQGPTGPAGPQGGPGVVNITQVGCNPGEGKFVRRIIPTYDAGSRSITITCETAEDQSGILEPPPTGEPSATPPAGGNNG